MPKAKAVVGTGAGAAAMFLFDPAQGRRRRAMLRDQAAHWSRRTARFAGASRRDLENRARAVPARVRSRLDRGPVDDDILFERVRSELGRVCRHPRSIEVRALDGQVTLRGPILRDDVHRVIRAVRAVPGVRGVEDQLEVHNQAGTMPGLQGGGGQPPPPPPRVDVLQQHWAPGTRAMVGTAGAGLAALGLRRGGWTGSLLGFAGGTVLVRGVTNLPLDRLTGAGAGRRAVDIHKTIVVGAPVEQVWDLWDGFERFPRFMTHVRDVTVGTDGRSHWVVDGPAGTTLRWDAEVTARVPQELLAWKTCPGQAIAHAGIVRLESVEDDRTRISVRLSYNPVAGAVGHGVARVLGADPKRRLDDDLARMKQLLETGRVARDAAQPA